MSNIKPERRDAAINRQLILDTASHLFMIHGVDNVSMNQIAQAAQIGSGTLYRRFRNKEELCQEFVKESVITFLEEMDIFLEGNKELPAEERLREIIRLFIQFREMRAELLSGAEGKKSAKSFANRTKSPLYIDVHEMIVQLLDEIQLNTSMNIFKADIILNFLSSEPYFFQKDTRGLSSEEILDRVCSIFISK